jgi:hypothetical protein
MSMPMWNCVYEKQENNIHGVEERKRRDCSLATRSKTQIPLSSASLTPTFDKPKALWNQHFSFPTAVAHTRVSKRHPSLQLLNSTFSLPRRIPHRPLQLRILPIHMVHPGPSIQQRKVRCPRPVYRPIKPRHAPNIPREVNRRSIRATTEQ